MSTRAKIVIAGCLLWCAAAAFALALHEENDDERSPDVGFAITANA